MKKGRNARVISWLLAAMMSTSVLLSPVTALAEDNTDSMESASVETTSSENNSDSSELLQDDTADVQTDSSSETPAESGSSESSDSEQVTAEESKVDSSAESAAVKSESTVSASADSNSASTETGTANETLSVSSYQDFLTDLTALETYADAYVKEHSGEDAYGLIINYIRTGVERYTTSAWTTFCGPENTAFVTYVADQDKANATSAEALRNLQNFTLPNGNEVDFGHMFGCMDMSYHTKNQNTEDLGSWAGDLCDLVWLVQTTGIDSGTVDEMADKIRTENDKYFLYTAPITGGHSFSQTDFYGDMDAYYLLQNMSSGTSLSKLIRNYCTANLTDKIRMQFFLAHRFPGKTTRADIRDAVYSTYKANEGITTLEGTYLADGVNADIRQASCYAFADYLYLGTHDESEKSYYSVFSTTSSTLAPGITEVEKRATTADNKQIVYFLATADVSRDDVKVCANYKDHDASAWGMQRVSEQMQAAETAHSDEKDSAAYIPNFKSIVGINADFYNMSTGEPTGLLVMDGKQYHALGNEGFFAILDDGSAVIGDSQSDFDTYKSRIKEAVGANARLVKDGKSVVGEDSSYTSNRVSRTCVGITYDGKVVFMVLDGRQEPYSAGGSPQEIAQIMLDAGCVDAVNLDGGGSSTFAAKTEGSDKISVVNSPSDGYERSVSSSLLIASTAKPSNVFDHAVLSSDYDYLTKGSSLKVTASGVTSTGGSIDLPEGASLKLADEKTGSLSSDGVFTASALGDAVVQLVSKDGTVLGSKTLHVVDPTELKFTKSTLNMIYGQPSTLPLEALYNGNPVKINSGDVTFGYLKISLQKIGTVDGKDVNTTKTELVFDYPEAGSMQDFQFTPKEGSGLRTLTIGAVLTSKLQDFQNTINSEYQKAYQEAIKNGSAEDAAAVQAQTAAINAALNTASKLTAYLYEKNEASVDFNTANGVDATGLLAWNRTVEDSDYDKDDPPTYWLKNTDDSGTATYTFAVDMSKVKIPDKLSGLLYMLPGGDQEGKTAWDFMLQLAERISPLTTVTFTLNIPDNFSVDTKNLRLANDFFTLKSAELDGNKLTVTFGFITQTEPVNPTTANPICVLSGLKLTPKADATWNEKNELTCSLTGEVSYDIYAHFHILKSLASQTEYQEKYGLYPYDNSTNQAGDYGAHFPNKVMDFKDSYTLKQHVKNGWSKEGENWSYYQDGKALTGVQELPSFTTGEDGSFWYDLGDKGTCKDKLTGFFEKDGGRYYARAGKLLSGWQSMEDSYYYYFDPTTGKAATGETKINGLTYTFNDKGQLIRGAFYSDGTGTRYNVAGRDLWRQFVTLDEGTYWIDASHHVAYGNAYTVTDNVKDITWYHFDEKTGLKTGVCTGMFTYQGDTYYADENGKVFYGLTKTANGIVFSETLGKVSVSKGVYVDSTTGQKGCALASGWYYAGSDGYLVKDGFATINDNTYYYSNYQAAKGLTKVGNDYYLFNRGNGKMYKDATMWIGDNDYGIASGMYYFGADGKLQLKNGFVKEGDYTYYYVNGERAKGFTKIGDDYYLFNTSSGMMYANGTYWVPDNSYGFTGGMYSFGSDGKMQLKNGFIEEGGYTYYYVNGERAKGFTKVGDDYYLFNASSGMMYTNGTYWVPDNSYGFPGGFYAFGDDGKMQLQSGFVQETHKDGKTYTYYYLKGEKVKGFTKIGDDYYMFNRSSGMMYTDATMWVGDNSYGIPGGMYYFGKDGKMVSA